MKTKKSRPWILIAAGALLLAVAGGLFVYSRVDDHLAGLRAQRVLAQVLSDGWGITVAAAPDRRDAYRSTFAAALDYSDAEQDEPDPLLNYTVIGIMEIPRLGLILPVLGSSSYALLDISVGRFMGSVDEKPERLVIAGHNYRSHFGQVHTLRPGDALSFTTPDGAVFHYELVRLETILSSGRATIEACAEWDIALLTCQRDNTFRTLARFREAASGI